VKKSLLIFFFAYAGCSFGAAAASGEEISYKEQAVAAVHLYSAGEQDVAIRELRTVAQMDRLNPEWKLILASLLIEDAPRKYGFPAPAKAYDEPLKLIKDVRSSSNLLSTPAQRLDANMYYAIALSLTKNVEKGLWEFKNVFSDPNVIDAGSYKYGLSIYANDLISTGHLKEAVTLLESNLSTRWSPVAAATYVQLLVATDVTLGTARYEEITTAHGEDAHVKLGFCDGLNEAHKSLLARECYASIPTIKGVGPLEVQYAKWKIGQLRP
jgi:hypothetical protein